MKYNKTGTERNQFCTCGEHVGIGTFTPYQRAQMYNWFRERRPKDYEAGYKAYLDSYERSHGMLASDDFLPDVKAAIYARWGNPQQQKKPEPYWN